MPEEISGECATPDSDGLFDTEALQTGDVVSLVLHADGLVQVCVNGAGDAADFRRSVTHPLVEFA